MITARNKTFLIMLAAAAFIYACNVNKLTSRALVNKDNRIQISYFDENPSVSPDPELTYFWQNAGEIKSTQGGFAGGLLHEEYRVFDDNGNLLVAGQFHKGLKDGEWKEWTKTGTLKKLAHWDKGQKDGTVLLFDDQGKVREKKNFKNDLLHGEQCLLQNDTLKVTAEYRHGELQVEEEDPDEEMPGWKKVFFKEKTQKDTTTTQDSIP